MDLAFYVHWTKVAGKVDEYEITYRVLPDGEWKFKTVRGTADSSGVKVYENDVQYIVFVRAINAVGIGEWSKAAYVIPTVPATPTPTPSRVPPSPTPVIPRSRDCEASFYSTPDSLEVTLYNPAEPSQTWHQSKIWWTLDFNFWYEDIAGKENWVELRIVDDGRWTLNIYYDGKAVYTISHGVVDLETGWEATNHVKLDIDSSDPADIDFYVNEVQVPFQVDGADHSALRVNLDRYVGTGDEAGQMYYRGEAEVTLTGNVSGEHELSGTDYGEPNHAVSKRRWRCRDR